MDGPTNVITGPVVSAAETTTVLVTSSAAFPAALTSASLSASAPKASASFSAASCYWGGVVLAGPPAGTTSGSTGSISSKD